MRVHLDPDSGVVGAAKAQQVVGDRAITGKTVQECGAGMRIDEPLAIEGADVAFGSFAGVAKYQFEMGIGGYRRCGARTDGTDVDAFVNSFEEPRERGAAMFHPAIIRRRARV